MKAEKDELAVTDVHCHILPQVDDGASSVEESIRMLRSAAQEGIIKIFVTPHYKAGRHNAGIGEIQQKLKELQRISDEEGLGIELIPGNEVLYFNDLYEALEEKTIQTMGESNHVLIEFLPKESGKVLRNAVDELIGNGYIPIIAHMERYECLHNNIEAVKELKALGARLQVNASSITGKNGIRIKRYVIRMLAEQLIDFLGTDAHDAEKRTPEIKKCISVLRKKKIAEDYIHSIAYKNAMELLEEI